MSKFVLARCKLPPAGLSGPGVEPGDDPGDHDVEPGDDQLRRHGSGRSAGQLKGEAITGRPLARPSIVLDTVRARAERVQERIHFSVIGLPASSGSLGASRSNSCSLISLAMPRTAESSTMSTVNLHGRKAAGCVRGDAAGRVAFDGGRASVGNLH